jgi:RimJ/RimL family protein N-acetyltransferase
VRLHPVPDPAAREAALAGRLGLDTAPGWPHSDTVAGLGFLDSGGSAFLVIDGEERIAGECGTKRPSTADGTVEIGYGLAAPSRGSGLGTAAVGALLDRLADRPEVRVVVAEVHVGNVASWRLLERLGFSPAEPDHDHYRGYRLELRAPRRPRREAGRDALRHLQ